MVILTNFQGKDFMLLYSLYSWPNVFLCFLGGYLIDKVFGIRYVLYLIYSLYQNTQIFRSPCTKLYLGDVINVCFLCDKSFSDLGPFYSA